MIQRIAKSLALTTKSVEAVLKLSADGATVPFMARYRKEATGNLDEVQIAQILTAQESFLALDKRREAILASITEQGALNPALKQALQSAHSLTELEDLYLPYKQKRRSRATMARERDLEALATSLMQQDDARIDFASFTRHKEVSNRDEALAGARDIIAELVSENAELRKILRNTFIEQAMIQSKLIKSKEKDAQKFRDYFDCRERLSRIRSHRLLAMLRGEEEKFLRIQARPDEDYCQRIIKRQFVTGHGFKANQVKEACEDSFKRLLLPSLEKECLNLAKEKADAEAIAVFARNLRDLVLSAPLGAKNILAFDPGFRTGAKVAAIRKDGSLIEHCNLFPCGGAEQMAQAEKKTRSLCQQHGIEAIAVGNGTAGRETEAFLKSINLDVEIISVDESGASIYSASECARKEFPDLDLTVRGAISIARRLQDPLAELVKLDPKSIGVGQYQHDVDQSALKKSLDQEVISCVNAVGVELNNASLELLQYVSGLGPKLAQGIIDYRKAHGAFKTRQELLKVHRLGAKAFEQAAGFLRISQGSMPLDHSAVHPENYPVVKKIARDLNLTLEQLLADNAWQEGLNRDKYLSTTLGASSFDDILAELAKPGRDPRAEFKSFSFDDSIQKPEDLYVGMKVPGIVTNITKFGAFVDIGVHQDGLLHISQISTKRISDPQEVLRLRQELEVTVIEIDLARKRISLSLIK